MLSADYEVVAALHSGEGLLGTIAKCRPDVVVLDIALPGQNGIELARRIRSLGHACRIVILTIHDDADYVRAALDAGASGYVLKPRLATDLVAALSAAVEGRCYVSPNGPLMQPGL